MSKSISARRLEIQALKPQLQKNLDTHKEIDDLHATIKFCFERLQVLSKDSHEVFAEPFDLTMLDHRAEFANNLHKHHKKVLEDLEQEDIKLWEEETKVDYTRIQAAKDKMRKLLEKEDVNVTELEDIRAELQAATITKTAQTVIEPVPEKPDSLGSRQEGSGRSVVSGRGAGQS